MQRWILGSVVLWGGCPEPNDDKTVDTPTDTEDTDLPTTETAGPTGETGGTTLDTAPTGDTAAPGPPVEDAPICAAGCPDLASFPYCEACQPIGPGVPFMPYDCSDAGGTEFPQVRFDCTEVDDVTYTFDALGVLLSVASTSAGVTTTWGTVPKDLTCVGGSTYTFACDTGTR